MLWCKYISNSEWCGIHLKEFSKGNCWQSDLWREWLGICGQLHMESEFQCSESSWLATSNDIRSFGFHISLALASKGCLLLSCEVLTKVSSGDSTAWPCGYDTHRHVSGPVNSYWSLLGYLLEVEKCHRLNLRKDKLESKDKEKSEKWKSVCTITLPIHLHWCVTSGLSSVAISLWLGHSCKYLLSEKQSRQWERASHMFNSELCNKSSSYKQQKSFLFFRVMLGPY